MSCEQRKVYTKRSFLALSSVGLSALALTPIALASSDEEEYLKMVRKNAEKPSIYRAHAFPFNLRVSPNISIEKMFHYLTVFKPLGMDVSYNQIKQPIEELLKEVGSFWERALDYKVEARSEICPVILEGKHPPSYYKSLFDSRYELIDEIKEKVSEPFKSKILSKFAADSSQNYPPSGDEFFCHINILLRDQNSVIGRAGSGTLGLVYLTATVDELVNWRVNKTDNFLAHEVGHSAIGLPDMYKGDWYDPDPYNIMGAGMWDYPLSQMRLAQSAKMLVLNNRNFKSNLAIVNS